MIHPRRSPCPRSLWLILPSALLFFLFHTRSVSHTHPAHVTHHTSPPPVNQQQSGTPLQQHHIFRPDGLLQVNPSAPHPIYHLISHAEQQWDNKLQQASKTLSHAVAEYERRYHRKPPLGFDAWWSYVRANDIQLPDEYDQIYRDLEPFWGMDPKDLHDIQAEWEAHEDSYTIGKDYDYDPIDVLNFTLGGDSPEDKADLLNAALEFVELLEDVKDAIPPFRAVFSPHDRPNLLTDWELKEMALQAAAKGKFIDINNPPEIKLDGWISACPPKSPAPRTNPSPPPPKKPKTFIHDHRLAMDPCSHPSILTSHGQFLLSHHKQGPIPHRKLIPQFSYSPSLLHHDIVPPTPLNWVQGDLPHNHPPWKERPDERLLWHGQTTGIWHEGTGTGDQPVDGIPWRSSHRDRLVAYANNNNNNNNNNDPSRRFIPLLTGGTRQKNLNRPWYDDDPWKYPPTTPATWHKKSLLFPLLFDVSFTDPPISCESTTTCEYLKNHVYEFKPAAVVLQDEGTAGGGYRFVMDVDGDGCSSRFKRLITSNTLVFKATVYPEWWLDRIQPWVHYVPIQNGYEDLADAIVFFQSKKKNGTGGIWDDDGMILEGNENEDLGEKIAQAGRDWSLKFWRREDLTAYMFRLMLEYARVMSLDRENMAFEYVGEVL